jgi:hypothetical protein
VVSDIPETDVAEWYRSRLLICLSNAGKSTLVARQAHNLKVIPQIAFPALK